MKKIFFISLLLIFFTSTILNASQKHFKVSYDPDYAPFSYLEDNKPEGLLIDLWRLWAEKNDYSIEFINGIFWDDAINLVKQEKVDFFLGTYPYEDWMIGSTTYYATQTSLFIHKNNSKSFSKSASYIIGIIGSDYEEHIRTNFPNSKIVIYEDYPTIFDDFLSKKVDLIYDDKIAIEFYALRNNNFHLIRSIKLLNNTPDLKAIAKKTELIKIFNEGFNKINAKELYEIESKWILNEKNRFYKKDFSLTKEEKEFIKNTPIKVAASKSWKPFNFQDSSGQASGIASDIWKIIEQKANIKSEYVFFSEFTSILDAIRTKVSDITYSAGKTKDREEYSIFTNTYIKFPLSIVTLKDENFIENIDYLFDKKIAVGKNFTAHKMLKEEYPDLDFLLVKNIEAGLDAVNNKEAYAFIDIKPSLLYNINKLGLKDLKVSGNTGLNFGLRMMIRDDYQILQSILNKAISNLSDKELNQIISRWGNIQFEDRFDYTKLWIILFVVTLIIFGLIYLNQMNIKRNKTLQNIVNERTKELKKLNKELEQRVELKTKELTKTNYILDEAQKIAKLGSFIYNLAKNKLTWSDELYIILELDKEKVSPSIDTLLNLVHKDDIKSVEIAFLNFENSNKRDSFEFRIVLKKEKIKYLQLTYEPTKFDENEKTTSIIGTILDLTQIKELEIQKSQQASILAQQSKMAAMGEMLENIAHQWRQPLSVISTASTGVQLQLEMNEEIEKEFISTSVISINRQAQYLSKTIDDFRNFFNPNKQKEFFNIKDTIDKSLYLVGARLKNYNVEVIKEYSDISVKTLESELIQILLNIFNNAIDVLKEKELEQKYLLISVYIKKDTLYIEIKDNAGGIPKRILNRVFEPYFTTKHKAKGTGIGLYMSNEIIKKHLHGELKVTNCSFNLNEKNFRGALFTIEIPLENNL